MTSKGKTWKLSWETKQKMRNARLGKDLSRRTGTLQSEETKKKISNSHKGKKMLFKDKEEWKRRSSESHKALWRNAEYATKIKVASKKNWENPSYREKVTKAILKGLYETRPTSLERQMIGIIERNNLSYKYTGDGSVLIGYKNPDFVNTNGEKICIEVANIFHHAEDYPEKRKAHFKQYGWECIVFRTDKLEEKEVIETLQGFKA